MPRAIRDIFKVANSNRFSKTKLKLSCYMMEIYVNELNDLLAQQKQQKLRITFKNKQVNIEGITKVEIESEQQALTEYYSGIEKRACHSTNLNDVSSRSHLIFSIQVEYQDPLSG